MSSEVAIKVEHVSKFYQIYSQPHDRLKQSIYPRMQRIAGRKPKQYFREFKALQDVSFDVARGETVGIIGRNGSGKSTLLQMICGTLAPTQGTIETSGRIAALLELGSGFNPEFTGRENVYLNAVVLGLTRDEIDLRYADIVAFADIGDFIDQPVKTYSSGMTLRLAFAVIAHVDADILVVDEALAVGDAFFTQKCMRFLRTFMKTGTVLFVSHDTGSVVNLCSKAILLDHGAMLAVGHPKAIAEQYLARLYETSQDVSGIKQVESATADEVPQSIEHYRDMRESVVNESARRNDIEIFQFKPGEKSEFGTGETVIASVRILDAHKSPLSWVVGGEEVSLEVRCKASYDLVQPIVGFQFMDRLGQVLFADNTYLAYQFNTPEVDAGEELVACFGFRLPVLPSGDYSITVAVANGSQLSHVQHHWVHDALIVRVHASTVCMGLIGIPMKTISLTVD